MQNLVTDYGSKMNNCNPQQLKLNSSFFLSLHKYLLHLQFCMMIDDDMDYIVIFFIDFS
jgi:hypothetical protein